MRVYPWSKAGAGEAATCAEAALDGCGLDHTVPADSYAAGASPYGALQMAGNTWEFVADCYHESYNNAPQDGSAWEGVECEGDHVHRGGGFDWAAPHLRAAKRHHGPGDGGGNIGIRCCRSTDD